MFTDETARKIGKMSKQKRPHPASGFGTVLAWLARIVPFLALLLVAWIAATRFEMLVHGQPVYAILVGATTVAALVGVIRAWRERMTRRPVLRSLGVVGALVWLAIIGWLAPSVAVQPALAAMRSSASVAVTENATQIVLTPTGSVDDVGLFFQPGAKVDARAYAAVLLPVAEAGHVVVIPKQPLGIAFLSTGAFTSARGDFAPVTRWVVGGHSLGGTVAAMTADSYCGSRSEPVVGLLLFASYPASDISKSLDCPVLSISGSRDGLSTPAKIRSTKRLLPEDAEYVTIRGAVHAYFGDYGTQSGDGQPTTGHAEARARISTTTVRFMNAGIR
ncbi:hypothetical protein BH09ACT1_BH09ACT1_07380 [soil metagenome]